MQNDVRLPRLLNGSLQEERRLYPSALSLTLIKNGISTAHMALPEEDGLPPVLSWVEIYTLKGSAGLFRVCQADTPAYGNGGVDLQHAICTLHDSVWNNRLDTNGNLLDTDYDGTVAGYMAAILSHQRTARWQLGTCADPGDYKKSGLNHDHLDALLTELAQNRAGYMLAYDFSTSPWTVSLVACSATVNAECRFTRNLKDGRKRSARAGMVNRLYLSIKQEEKKDTAPAIWSGGEDKGQPTGAVTRDEDKTTETGVTYQVYNDTASQDAYGVLEGTAEISLGDVPDVSAWVAAYFRDHAGPITQASADAWELVKATGEPWDQYDLGKWARIALKRDGYPAEGPIEQIKYPDLLGDPEKAQVDLTRTLPKFSERLSALRSAQDAASRGGGGGGGSAKAQELTHWAQVVQHIEELIEGTGLKTLWETGIELDAQQGVTLYSLYNGLTSNIASITLHNDSIEMLVQKSGVLSLGSSETLYSKITQTESGITSLVGKTGILSLGAQETLYSLIQQNASAIQLKVSAGNVATQLAVEVGNVTISGGNLIVSGMITSSSLAAEIARLQTVTVPGYLNVTGTAAFQNGANFGDDVVAPEGQFTALYFGANGDCSAMDAVCGFGTPTESGGQISIPYNTFGQTGAGTINFNIAATQTYLDGVAAAEAGVTLSGAWTGNLVNGKAYKATASNGAASTSPAVNSVFANGNKTWAADRKSFSQMISVRDANGADIYGDTLTFSTAESYAEGESSVTVTGATGWISGANTLTLSNGATYTTYMPGNNSATWYSTRQGNSLLVYCTAGGREYSHTFSL